MKLYLFNDYKKHTVFGRSIEIIPSLSMHFYENWRFESVRLSWLGFTIGIDNVKE
jgi:hypothetical protein